MIGKAAYCFLGRLALRREELIGQACHVRVVIKSLKVIRACVASSSQFSDLKEMFS